MTEPASVLEAALRGARAVARVEHLQRGLGRDQHAALAAATNRALLAAADAGATLDQLAEALGLTRGWTSARVSRARREGRSRIPNDLLTVADVAERMGVKQQRVHEWRSSGRLTMRMLHGWWVTTEDDLVALALSLRDQPWKGAVVALAPLPDRPRTPNPAWREVPMCGRPAPPPHGVWVRCRADRGHEGDHDFTAATRITPV